MGTLESEGLPSDPTCDTTCNLSGSRLIHPQNDQVGLAGLTSLPVLSQWSYVSMAACFIFISKKCCFKCQLCAFQILLSRINNYTITEEEIGTLLFHAINKPNEPLWFMFNEAGLYWRALGNSTFAIACLQRALDLAPPRHQDIPLVNLANLLMHYGLHHEASKLLLQALAINSSEPLTFLSLGNAYLALKNISGAIQAFRQALNVTTRCLECEGSLKLVRCMQFYPFLYATPSSACSGKQLSSAGREAS